MKDARSPRAWTPPYVQLTRRTDLGQTMGCETFTVTAVCRPLRGGGVEGSYRAPHVAFPLTARADTLEDVELVVAEIVSALAGRPADAVTVEVVLDLNDPRVARTAGP
jgi:hypothetical protein